MLLPYNCAIESQLSNPKNRLKNKCLKGMHIWDYFICPCLSCLSYLILAMNQIHVIMRCIIMGFHCTTVLPAKSDSDVMFCLQSYQGLIIDISLVY